jgi:hypothetical protein
MKNFMQKYLSKARMIVNRSARNASQQRDDENGYDKLQEGIESVTKSRSGYNVGSSCKI